MAGANCYVDTGGPVTVVANTPKTVLAVVASANVGLTVKRLRITFNGTSSTAKLAKVEVCQHTAATAGASSPVTPRKADPDRTGTIQFTAGKNFTAEPTVLNVTETLQLPVYNGGFQDRPTYDIPVPVPPGKGLAIRVTTEAGEADVGVAVNMVVEE